MKDYKVSEIKKICLQHIYCHDQGGCPFYQPEKNIKCEMAQLSKTPASWEINEKDGEEE